MLSNHASVTLGTFTRAHHTHSNTDTNLKQWGYFISLPRGTEGSSIFCIIMYYWLTLPRHEFGKFSLSDSWEAMKGTYILFIEKEQKITLYVD